MGGGVTWHRSVRINGNVKKNVIHQTLYDAELFWLEPAPFMDSI